MLPEPLAVTIKVTSVLERLDIPYLIGGSLASTIYGMVRTTQDSDIVAEMNIKHIHPFIQALQTEFFIDEAMITDAIQRNSSFNLIHRESIFKVDVFIPEKRPFHYSQLSRAQKQIFVSDPEVSANFSSAEDTILSKLEWYRMGGEVSERQWRDVIGILKAKSDELDLKYLENWAKELDIKDLLEKAVKEAT